MRFCLLFLFPFLSHTCIVRWIHHCLEDQRLLQLQTIHLIQKWLSVGSCWVQKMSWAWRRKHTSVNRVGWKWLLKLEDDLEKKKKESGFVLTVHNIPGPGQGGLLGSDAFLLLISSDMWWSNGASRGYHVSSASKSNMSPDWEVLGCCIDLKVNVGRKSGLAI